ncbi:DUF402 domain-containing protein [Streptomyces goshikiensis]|uniref:DUF402 domain-containing protein n=1 Tax=Streptomyces goshikiensis TaxID=1942 RepID=UPI003715140D
MVEENASVLVDVRKYDGSLSARWTAVRLGEDEHGVWLGTAQGVPVSSSTGEEPSRFAYVMLVPRGEWWTATFCADPGPEVYCDVCTVPDWNAGGTVVSMVDLDLDVVRPRGGGAHVEDEDQFAERRMRYGYPDSVVEAARQTCEWLMERVRRDGDGGGDEPFASTYRYWLGLIG